MPYKLSDDQRAVMVKRNGKWKTLKRYVSKRRALAYLRALEANVAEAHK